MNGPEYDDELDESYNVFMSEGDYDDDSDRLMDRYEDGDIPF